MPIDPEEALKAEPTLTEVGWTRRDVLLYHLSLGAGSGPDPELAYTYERDLGVLPTFAVVAGKGISAGEQDRASMSMPGIDVDVRRILHAGQELTVHRPLPASGTATLSSRVTEVWDKGKAALIAYEQSASGEDGDPPGPRPCGSGSGRGRVRRRTGARGSLVGPRTRTGSGARRAHQPPAGAAVPAQR